MLVQFPAWFTIQTLLYQKPLIRPPLLPISKNIAYKLTVWEGTNTGLGRDPLCPPGNRAGWLHSWSRLAWHCKSAPDRLSWHHAAWKGLVDKDIHGISIYCSNWGFSGVQKVFISTRWWMGRVSVLATRIYHIWNSCRVALYRRI